MIAIGVLGQFDCSPSYSWVIHHTAHLNWHYWW